MSALIVLQNPDTSKPGGWDKEMTNPIPWTVSWHKHIRLQDRVFFMRSGPRGGIFATGVVAAPPAGQSPVFWQHNPRVNKVVALVNVQVDLPSVSANGGQPCSVSHPVLITKSRLKADPRFGGFFGQIIRNSGIEVPPDIVGPLLEEFREVCQHFGR